jgi:hypothetical protein
MSIFATMSQIDTRKIVEKKNGFTYLSWAHALRLLKQHVPEAAVTKHIFKQADDTYLPYMVDAQGYAYVQVTITLGKDEPATTEIMPILNHANRPIQKPNSFEVNASIQRCMAKAISMATGLGLHLYSGEDTPQPSPVSAGSDSSEQKAERGAASGQLAEIRDVFIKEERSDAANTPQKIKSPLSLADEVALCPDIDSLKALYNRVQLKLSATDRELFTKKKQELLNG